MQQPPAKVITAIYASTSGNTEWVVEQIANFWRSAGLQVSLQRAEQANTSIWQQNDRFLLATSTWDHGAINPFFNNLFEALKKQDCTGKEAAFVGMGDVRYEPVLFCGGMELLRNTWIEQGGVALGVPLKFNGEPYAKFESVIKPWAEKQLQLIRSANTENAALIKNTGTTAMETDRIFVPKVTLGIQQLLSGLK